MFSTIDLIILEMFGKESRFYHFFVLQASDEGPHVRVMLIHTLVETIIPSFDVVVGAYV
jgi:hypothetical protein